MSDAAFVRAPVLPALKAGLDFAVSEWRRGLIVGAPYVLAYALTSFAAARMAADPTGVYLWFPLFLVMFVAATMMTSALLRLRLRGEAPGFHGLSFSGDEQRYLGVVALMFGLFLIVGLILFVPLIAVVIGVGIAVQSRENLSGDAVASGDAQLTALFGPADWAVLSLVFFGAGALILWLTARLSLAFPATIAQKQVRLLSAWPISHRNAWRIAAAILIASAANAALVWLIALVMQAITGVSPLTGGGAPWLALIGAIPVGLFQAGVATPFWTGMMSAFYLKLAPETA